MKAGKIKALIALLAILVLGIYYYVALPAINIHSSGFWFSIIIILVAIAFAYIVRKKYGVYEIKESKFIRVMGILVVLVVATYFIGSLLSSPIINAKKYQKLLKVEDSVKLKLYLQNLSKI